MRVTRWTWMVAVCGSLIFAAVPARAAEPSEEYYELMKVFIDSFEQIERNYVKDVDRRELVEAAIKGMMDKLDPYSNYITPDDLARFNQVVEQEFGGIGIQVNVDPKTRRLTIMTPLPGTPAWRAGLRAGDQIIEIEGKSTEGYSLDDAVQMLKGKAGEEVNIGVIHTGMTKVEKVKMVREIIHLATVLGDRYNADGTWNFFLDEEKKIAYIRVSSFSRNTTRELQEALTTLQKNGMKGLILDLRFNPGGLLSAATEISDLFVEDGKIVSTKGRNTEERVWNAQKEGTFSGFPMAILVNHYSASASEIVSACLQDHHRAVIIGERTWGKGSVQNVIELEGGKSALKLTTAGYFRPSGKNIHRYPDSKDTDEWGVMPDENYVVDLNDQETADYLDYRRNRDVLITEGELPKSDFVDRQLQKGVEYVLADPAAKPETKPEAPATEEKKAEEKKPEEKKPEEKKDEAKPEPEKTPETKTPEKTQSRGWRIHFPIKMPRAA